MEPISNTSDLRQMLLDTIADVRSGKTTPSTALVVAKISTTILQTAKLDLDFARFAANNKDISDTMRPVRLTGSERSPKMLPDASSHEPQDDEIDEREAPCGKPQSKGGSRSKGDDAPEFPPVNDSPGELVRATRESLNLSQADLAELIDVGVTRLATFERRSTGLTAMELGRLADELGFDGADREKIGVEQVTCG